MASTCWRLRNDRVFPDPSRRRLWLVRREPDPDPAYRAAADAGGGNDHLCRPQDLGGNRAAQGPQCRRSFRSAAKLCRWSEGFPAGNDHSLRIQSRPVPDGADNHFHGGATCLGGNPVRAGHGAGGYQCRPALCARDQFARRVRRGDLRLGLQLQISLLLGDARCGADDQL